MAGTKSRSSYGKKKNNKSSICEIIENGITYTTSEEIAPVLTTYFLNYASTLRTPNYAGSPTTVRNNHSMFLRSITENDVNNVIKMLEPKCSPGLDGIIAKDLKLVEIITPVLMLSR